MKKQHIFERIDAFVHTNQLITPDQTIIIGFSGGPDSVFLLHYLVNLRSTLNLTLIAAHLNHGWRPEADQDVIFCQEMAKYLNVEFVPGKMSDLSLSHKFNGSHEEYGRTARRHFFTELTERYHAHAIALGHHTQDQQETFFIRLLRGASLTGLTGMKPRQGNIIRPLLTIDKKDILAYLDEHHIPYLHDITNDSDLYLRNRIRKHVIPALESCDTRFAQTFVSTISRLQSLEEYLERHTQDLFESAITCIEGKTFLNLTQLLIVPLIMQERIVLHWLCQEQVPFTPTEAFFTEILNFLRHERGGTHQLHTAWRIKKKHGNACIEKI